MTAFGLKGKKELPGGGAVERSAQTGAMVSGRTLVSLSQCTRRELGEKYPGLVSPLSFASPLVYPCD